MKDLLTPRFRVIGEYPNCKFREGDLLQRIPRATDDWYHADIHAVVGGHDISELRKYPHLFRELKWYEDLDSKDFPKYCKVGLEVANSDDVCIDVEKNRIIHIGHSEYLFGKCTFLPATKEEYEEYIAKKQ